MGSLRAIDLYSGIGGWSIGLGLGGIEVVTAYEWWNRAVRTHEANFPEFQVVQADIRALPLETFPKGVDIVVGSPPCTQFSFANRGGSGDISDGLRDIEKFLEVVEHLEPVYWAMENVPRVAGILERELERGGSLHRFRRLVDVIEVFNSSDFGVPQGRRRMIAGSFPVDLLRKYRAITPTRTLGGTLEALSSPQVVDPSWGHPLPRELVTENLVEPSLTEEELRMNREAKTFHPVYNRMSFPDATDRPARTVTALCTRVSRESIIVPDGDGGVRRLTIRERATLQGFPITFQFYGTSYSDKLKMIGNAIPPPLTFFIGQAILGRTPEQAIQALSDAPAHPVPESLPEATPPRAPRKRYPAKRRFRAALPHLRFGSGVRFELANSFDEEGRVSWGVAFYYGPSSNITRYVPSDEAARRVLSLLPSPTSVAVSELASVLVDRLATFDPAAIQPAWTHSSPDAAHPFVVVDMLGDIGEHVYAIINEGSWTWSPVEVLGSILSQETLSTKMQSLAERILAGVVVGGQFNAWMDESVSA